MFVVKDSKTKEIIGVSNITPDNFERYVKYRGDCKCKKTKRKGKQIFSSFISLADDSELGLAKECKDDAKLVKGGKYTTDVLNGFLVVKKKDDGDNKNVESDRD
jgi:hypothetical protein